jgi:YD repeat-containing protein
MLLRRTLRRSRRSLLASVAAATGVLLVPAAASAAPYENFTYSGTDEFTYSDCGTTLHEEVTFSGHVLTKEVRGSDGQAFLAHQNYRFESVFTNVETGLSMVMSGTGTFKEIHATHLGGDLWEFTWHDAGQPLRITDPDGTVLAFERGVVQGSIVFDTLGDGQPGGELVSEEEPVFRGKFETGNLSFCDFVEAFIS